MVSTRDIKAIDPVTGDTKIWDEPRSREQQILSNAVDGLPPYDALELLKSLSIMIEDCMADLRDEIQRADR